MDWDLRGESIEDYYARFGERRMPDLGIWHLSAASAKLPASHIGFQAWITMVSGVPNYRPELQRWAVALADHIGVVRVRRSRRLEPFAHSYRRDWGRQAGIDGLCIALFGRDDVPGGYRRAEQLDCDKRAFQRVRNFVTGATVLAMNEFREELSRSLRGTVLDEWDHGRDFYRIAQVTHATQAAECFEGNARTVPLPSSDGGGYVRANSPAQIHDDSAD